MCEQLPRPTVQLGDILRRHGPTYAAQHPLSAEQAKVLRRLAACRTAALGGHVDTCVACGFSRNSYNSCRDRHCPRCQASKRAAWLERHSCDRCWARKSTGHCRDNRAAIREARGAHDLRHE